MSKYQWVQRDREVIETDLTSLAGASNNMNLESRDVNFVLRWYTGDKILDKQADLSGTVATVELTPDHLSRSGKHEAEWVITGGQNDPTTLPKTDVIPIAIRKSIDEAGSIADPLPEDGIVDVLTAQALTGSIAQDSQIENIQGPGLFVNNNALSVQSDFILSSISGETIEPQEVTIGSESSISGYGGALSVDSDGNLVASDNLAYSKAAFDTAQLSSGDGVVDTGVATDSRHYNVNLNPGNADIGVSLDGSGDTYVIYFEENTTEIGNPTVGWELVRSEL
jgi:hypothetical protein